jgi:hypothetical protein
MHIYIYIYICIYAYIHMYIQVVKDIDKALMSHLRKLSGRESPFGKAEFRGRVDTWIPFLPYEFKHKCDVVVKALEDRVLSYYLNEAPETQRFVVGWDRAAVELLASSQKSEYSRSLLPL